MGTYECKVCRGTYSDPQADGSRYFHACPSTRNPAYEDQLEVDPDGNRVLKGQLDPRIARTVPRVDARNENVEVKPDGKVAPKAEGAGKDTIR